MKHSHPGDKTKKKLLQFKTKSLTINAKPKIYNGAMKFVM